MRLRSRSQVTTLWWPARWRLALLAVAVAGATAVGGAALAGGDWWSAVAVGHVSVTVAAIARPAALWMPVGTGLALTWGVVAPRDGVEVLVVLPVVVGVVATAELLGLVARLGLVIQRDPGPDLRQLGVTAALATMAGAVPLAAGALEGPGGWAAALLAVGACVVLALLLGGTDG